MKNLNKNILAMSIAAAMASGSVFAESHKEAEAEPAVKISGFIDVIYTAVDDGKTKVQPAKSESENKFLADGEIDFEGNMDGTTVRLDLDVFLDNAQIEQAYLAHPIGPVTLIAGVFNNPIGYEAEDAPDLDFTSHNFIYDILNNQTALNGNNLAGAALAGAIGPVTLTGAFVNDLGHAAEENSLALIANLDLAGIALEAGYVTQDDSLAVGTPGVQPFGSAGDVFDINATWSNDLFMVGIDYMMFKQLLDPAMVVWAGVNIGDFNIRARYETVEADSEAQALLGVNDSADAVTLYASYALSGNTSVAVEIKDGSVQDSGLGDVLANSVEGSRATVEFLGTF